MNLRVYWMATKGFLGHTPTGVRLSGIVVCGGGRDNELIVRGYDGKLYSVRKHWITSSEWVDRLCQVQ